MTNTYAMAYTEVLEILSHFSEEEYSKIPQAKINFYKSNMDKNYIYKIDSNIDLSKQHISKEANAILVSLFRDYFATESQNKTLNNLLNQNYEKLDKLKKEEYNPDNIFKKSNQESEIEQEIPQDNVAMVEYKENIFKKIINKIKNIFHIN